MSEQDSIQNASSTCTRESIARDLRGLGVQPGMTLLVHSSLSSLGWVCGGPLAVVQALMDVLTEAGTLVMPAHTGNYADPASWQNPPVPQPWWQIVYDAMPAFDPQITPTYLMGAIAETFRTRPGVVRSNHPQVSFTAWGRNAQYITCTHTLEYGLGEGSPLARVYDLGGYVLLLGVGYDRNTSFHLAEYRCPGAEQTMLGAPILENGRRVWRRFRDIEIDADVFPMLGLEMEQCDLVQIGKMSLAECRFFPQRAAVDFATRWYTRRRER
ncbi:MAG: BA2930 family N-acetyltransferase [Ktedonobacteraceae bacterium]